MPAMNIVGFLGLGVMGEPMAARCRAAGLDLRVWNRSPGKAASLSDAGATACANPAEAARGAALLCLCLTDATAVEAVMFGADGAVGALAADALVIDFSTIGPAATRQLAERVKREAGASWLDCPVSGGVRGAVAGALTVFAGGSGGDLDRARAVLDTVSARVTHMGDIGAGQATKLSNQLIVSTTLLAIAEAIRLAERLGVDVASLPEALKGGFADSAPLQIFGPRMAASTDPGPAVSELLTMAKDIAAIRAAGDEVGVAMPLIENVARLYAQIVDAGFGHEDLPALMHLYRGEESAHG